MTKFLRRMWLPIVVTVSVAIGATTVMRFRAIFGADPFLATPKSSDTAERFTPKVVTYEIRGSAATAVINYLDLEANPRRVENAMLPWSLTLSTTAPAAMPNILAQGSGQTITCRITVDDKLRDERTVTGFNAETFCLVKSA